MKQKKDIRSERRRFVRLEAPVVVSYIAPRSDTMLHASTKNISADGIRFQTTDRSLKEADVIPLHLQIPQAANPVHAKGVVVWKKRISLEDGAPYDVGIEFAEIEEDNKNTFLRFLCDLMYSITSTTPPRQQKK